MKFTKVCSVFLAGILAVSTTMIPVTAKTEQPNKINHVLEKELKKNSKGEIRVIVETSKKLSDANQKKLLGNKGKFKRSYHAMNGFSAELTAQQILDLQKSGEIKSIHLDQVVKVSGVAGYPYNDDVARTPAAPQVWNEIKTQGEGVGVAVIDTGVYPHRDLILPTNRIVAFKDFVNGRTSAYDDNGHGTHVSGIVAGNGTDTYYNYIGVAPKTNIVGLKALDSNGSGYMSSIISAIDWAIQYKSTYNIKVLNLSLGAPYQYTDDPLMQAVQKAYNSGILVVAAGGNEGEGSLINSPAASPYALAVGGTDSIGTVKPYDDRFASFSVRPQAVNGVTKPEIFAPSLFVVSLNAPSSTEAQAYPEDVVRGEYYVMSGTSMATPVVSGTAALLFSKYPTMTPAQVKSKIVDTGITVGSMKVLNSAQSFGLTPNWNYKNPPVTTTTTSPTKKKR